MAQQKRRSRISSASDCRPQAAFFRPEVLLLRPDELPVREEEEPRPLVVVLALVLPRPEEEELRRPDEMLLVFELRLELLERVL